VQSQLPPLDVVAPAAVSRNVPVLTRATPATKPVVAPVAVSTRTADKDLERYFWTESEALADLRSKGMNPLRRLWNTRRR
jgi:hypothetical protein